MIVPSPRLLVPLGDLDPVTAAPLTDAGLTPYHAIKRSLHRPRAWLHGGGDRRRRTRSRGRAAPQGAVPSPRGAVDLDEGKLRLAEQLGADHTVVSDEDAVTEIRGLSDGFGCELVIDCVGAQPTVELAAAVSRSLGDIALVGIGGGTLGVSFSLPPETSVAAPTGQHRRAGRGRRARRTRGARHPRRAVLP